VVGLVGVGLISTSLGTDSFIVMELPREDSTSERHLGFFIGSDYIKIATSEENYKSWPVPCGGNIYIVFIRAIRYLNIFIH